LPGRAVGGFAKGLWRFAQKKFAHSLIYSTFRNFVSFRLWDSASPLASGSARIFYFILAKKSKGGQKEKFLKI